jgi:hypothetical protein
MRAVDGSNGTARSTEGGRQAEAAREREKQKAPESNAQSEAVVVRDTPDRIRIAEMIGAPTRKRESYPERVARLQNLIDLQVEHVRKLADDQGTDITDYKMVYVFNIAGEAGEVCAFCGRQGCQYRPVAVLKENREIDLLKDAMTVAQEVATKLGISYGLIAYDDDLIPLREVMPPDDLADRAGVLSLFGKFKDRKDRPDITDRKWLDEMLAKWDISMKYRNVTGEPCDRAMAELATKMIHEAAGNGPSAVMLATSQKPKSSLRPIEAGFKQAHIQAAALAVGKQAKEISRQLFSQTVEVMENHGLVESIGQGTGTALQLEEK